MAKDESKAMESRPKIETARASSASSSRLGNDRRAVTSSGDQCQEQQAHHSTKSQNTFKTDAMRQAEIRARAHLRKRRLHHASVTLAGESEPPKGKGSQMYFLSDGDIKDMVGIVMDTLRQSFVSLTCPRRVHGSGPGTKDDDPTTSGFEYGRTSITPRLSAAADPATTISLPRTVFSYTNWGGREFSTTGSRFDLSTKTTILSRGSVSEIVWAESPSSDVAEFRDSLSSAGLFEDGISQHCLTCHSLSKCVRCQKMIEAERTDSNCRFASLFPPSTNPALNKRVSRSTDDGSNITSFPELRPRQCTNDWLKPPVEIEQLLQTQSSNLYRRGVDAHSGLIPNSPESVWEQPLPLSVPCDDSVFSKNPLFSAGTCFQERRGTESSAGASGKHLGNSISSVSRGRRSSQIPTTNQSPWESQGQLFPHVLNKLRQNSQHSIREEGLHSREWGTWSPEPEMLLPLEPSQAANTRSRDSIIRERTLKRPTVDTSGIYEALTGSRMTKPKKRCATCSEDNRPHVCEDDLVSCT
ncbi:hypothetical protein C2857_006344 [Epichloe festucae Fl1]|uniref:Uncharacterized protein n=1 Tax=Epichloe festucae (strain Fl1) TaxID=877507 RepID=A0A7S9KLJ7_EPIFF|nr:hypothetical protein C2857_006344 [Epichloe festucae Fl1]